MSTHVSTLAAAAIGLTAAMSVAPLFGAAPEAKATAVAQAASGAASHPTVQPKMPTIGPKKPPIVPADKPAMTNKVVVPAAAKP
jgi:hypothetical protein